MSLVFGLLLESVTTNLSDIGRARLEARALQMAEYRAREIEAEIGSGIAVEDGTTEGAYEAPFEDLHWRVTVSAHTLQLPADYPGKEPPSPLFSLTGGAARATDANAPPPLRMVEVRVFPAEGDPEDADPFVLLVTSPPDSARLDQLRQQQQQQQEQQEQEPADDDAGSEP